jgi:hypothetical protein
MSLIPGIITLNLAGIPSSTTEVPEEFNNGTNTLRGYLGLSTIPSGAVALDGLTYNPDGSVVVSNGGIIANFVNGYPVDTLGQLCVAYDGTPSVWNNGIPYDAAGRICLATPVTPP